MSCPRLNVCSRGLPDSKERRAWSARVGTCRERSVGFDPSPAPKRTVGSRPGFSVSFAAMCPLPPASAGEGDGTALTLWVTAVRTQGAAETLDDTLARTRSWIGET